jgi:hypothetical protein
LQKRLRNVKALLRKTPRLFLPEEILWGLRCGLSGNPALPDGNAAEMALKGNCRPGDMPVGIWESLLDLKPQSLPIKLPPVFLLFF